MNEIEIAGPTPAGEPHEPVSADTVFFRFLEVAQVLEARLEEALAKVGLSAAKFEVLHQLALAGNSLPLRVLAHGKRCVPSNMTQLVDRLEGEGLVRRIDDPLDRRIVRAELTESGRERAEAGIEAVRIVQRAFAATLTKSDRAALDRVFSSVQTS